MNTPPDSVPFRCNFISGLYHVINRIASHPFLSSASLYYERVKTFVPNFQTSSTMSSLRLPWWFSEKTTRSASAPSSRQPLIPCSPSIAAGVEVTAFRACGMLAPDQLRKLDTHSMSVIELVYH